LKPQQICVQPRQEYAFFPLMATKRFQVRTEEKIEQLIRDKSSKFTNKAIQNNVKTLKEFCEEQNLQQSFDEPQVAQLH